MFKQLLVPIFIFFSCSVIAQNTNRLAGLGFRVVGDAVVIQYKILGTPAAETPLYAGDTVFSVNSNSVQGKTIEQVIDMVKATKEDSVKLGVFKKGVEAFFMIGLEPVKDIKLRRAALIQNFILSKNSIPTSIPVFTNYGFITGSSKSPVYSEKIQYMPGGFVKRTSRRNRDNFRNTEMYEEDVFDLLDANLNTIYSGMTRLTYQGHVDDNYYFMMEKTDPKVSGSPDVTLWSSKYGEVFKMLGLRPETRMFGGKAVYLTAAKYIGQNVIAMRQSEKPFKWALFNPQMKPLTDYEFDNVSDWDGPGAFVKKKDKWKIIGFPALKEQSEGPWKFQDKDNFLYGYADANGKTVVAPKFDKAYEFREGLACVRDAATGLYGFLNKKGGWAIPCTLNNAASFSGGLAPVIFPGKNWTYINTEGKQAIPGDFSSADPFEYDGSYAIVKKQEQHMVIDNIGNVVLIFTDPTERFYAMPAAPGLFEIHSDKLVYFRDIYDKVYLNYDAAKGRLDNPNDKRLANERDAFARQKQREWEEYRSRQEQREDDRRTTEANKADKENDSHFKTCTECNGSGYIVYLFGKKVGNTTYVEKPITYSDEYGIQRRNYFTWKCSRCKGSGVIGK